MVGTGAALLTLREPGLIGPSANFKRTTSIRKCHLEFLGSRIDLGAGVTRRTVRASFPRKEVIQPHLPVRLPCYDFTPIICPALDGCLLAVGPPASCVTNFRGVTGGVYKTRERIQRSVLICVY